MARSSGDQMGSLTHYKLTASDDRVLRLEMEDKQDYTRTSIGSFFCRNTMPGTYSSDAIKWYEHEADMLEVSRRWPGVVFTLYGIHEEGSHFKKYFLNGKVQSAPGRLTFDDFDSTKLT